MVLSPENLPTHGNDEMVLHLHIPGRDHLSWVLGPAGEMLDISRSDKDTTNRVV